MRNQHRQLLEDIQITHKDIHRKALLVIMDIHRRVIHHSSTRDNRRDINILDHQMPSHHHHKGSMVITTLRSQTHSR